MSTLLRGLFIWSALFAGLSPNAARADWMNLTGAETAPNIAEIKVLDDRVRVAVEIYIGDLATFEALVPDDWVKPVAADRPPLADRLRVFSADIFQVVTDDGTKLQANLRLAEPRLRKDRVSPFAGMINPMTRRRVPDAPKDKRVLYAELDYPFEGKPKTLTFIPPTDDKGIGAAAIGFIAYHKAVPIIDFRYLSGASTVNLDWADPWYTKFNNPNLKRHHKSALMSFLYVEPREVRHEALIRIRDLQEWTDLGLKGGGATISTAELARVKEQAHATFFATRNPLKGGRSAAAIAGFFAGRILEYLARRTSGDRGSRAARSLHGDYRPYPVLPGEASAEACERPMGSVQRACETDPGNSDRSGRPLAGLCRGQRPDA